jgi:hypothetical protein
VTDLIEVLARATIIGVAGAALMDVWGAFSRHVLRVQGLDYALLGRWIGHLPRRRFLHDRIADAAPVRRERALGWAAHYSIGIAFALPLIAIWGLGWARSPTFLPAMVVGLVTVLAPWLVMQPAMGAGISAAKAPRRNVVRLRNLATHAVYGAGLYVSALLLAVAWP